MKAPNVFRILTLGITLMLLGNNPQSALSAQNSITYDGKFTVTEFTTGEDPNGGNKSGPTENTLHFVVVNNRATGDLNGTVDPLTGKATLTQQTEFGVISYEATFILDKNTHIVSIIGSVNGKIVVSGATVIIKGTIKGQAEVKKFIFTHKAVLPTAQIGKKYAPYSLCNNNKKPFPKTLSCGGALFPVTNPTGGVAPYTFRISAGILPGLNLKGSGEIYGTPSKGLKPGNYKMTICVYDAQDSWNARYCWKTSITIKK